jgi:colanic acid biosynthesis protein WcaH
MWIEESEYKNLKKKIPILCVDLITRNKEGKILLVKRVNQPAKDTWWFPGGRVMLGESRLDTARRKLKEECGIFSDKAIEWKTFDFFLYDEDEQYTSHTVSTFFISDSNQDLVVLDSQSSDYMWKTIDELNEMISEGALKNVVAELIPFLKTV